MYNAVWCWSLSQSKYVQEAVRNCAKHLKNDHRGKYELIKFAPNEFPLGYDPDADVSPKLPLDVAS